MTIELAAHLSLYGRCAEQAPGRGLGSCNWVKGFEIHNLSLGLHNDGFSNMFLWWPCSIHSQLINVRTQLSAIQLMIS